MALAGTFLGAVISGCSGGGGGDANGGPAPTLDQEGFALLMAEQICGSLEPCCESGGHAFDLETCVTKERDAALQSYQQIEAQRLLAFDEAEASTCASALPSFTSTCEGFFQRGLLPDECSDGFAFSGARQIGETCETRIHCVSGATCIANRCQEPLPTGEVCEEDGECAEGACIQNRCAPQTVIGAGEPCRSDTLCQIDDPEEGPSGGCVGTPATCARLVRGVAGSPCVETCSSDEKETCLLFDPSALDPVSEVAVCYVTDGLSCQDYTCQPLVPLGGTCDSSADCEVGTRCLDDVCSSPLATGEACSSDSACGHEICFDGTCRPRSRDGEPCGRTDRGFLSCELNHVCTSLGLGNPDDAVCRSRAEYDELSRRLWLQRLCTSQPPYLSGL